MCFKQLAKPNILKSWLFIARSTGKIFVHLLVTLGVGGHTGQQ